MLQLDSQPYWLRSWLLALKPVNRIKSRLTQVMTKKLADQL